MWKKIALNVLYNIVILISLYAIYIGVDSKRYEFCLAGAFAAAIVVILKLKLIKQIKETTKQP
ncbi:MAG: DUF6358 family protein [Mucilaginibacter sp.]